ncbi:unnamed protein product [Amoebophrya sp. A120]|nr:unnamed protein product [Amoebophrya sp. A120]|eukprot:GSA120T00022431001.1
MVAGPGIADCAEIRRVGRVLPRWARSKRAVAPRSLASTLRSTSAGQDAAAAPVGLPVSFFAPAGFQTSGAQNARGATLGRAASRGGPCRHALPRPGVAGAGASSRFIVVVWSALLPQAPDGGPVGWLCWRAPKIAIAATGRSQWAARFACVSVAQPVRVIRRGRACRAPR